jgi:hypothetical protein
MELQKMLTRSGYVVVGAMLVALNLGCSFPGGRGLSGGRDATYKVENQPGGFLISSTYSRPSLAADNETVRSSCKRSLIATAQDYADSFGRTIQPLEEGRVRVSMNHDGTTGMTRCDASVPVAWSR